MQGAKAKKQNMPRCKFRNVDEHGVRTVCFDYAFVDLSGHKMHNRTNL